VGSNPPKDDLQHATGVFTWGDPSLLESSGYSTTGDPEDLWCIFACDRWEVNGASYVDFEFNQAKMEIDETTRFIVSSAPSNDLDGNPTGGRTRGDILITVEFTGGGNVGNVWVDQWEKDGLHSPYYWKGIDIEGNPNIYAIFNEVETPVPWPIYDQTTGTNGLYTYSVNQFVEGAINLSRFMEELTGESFKCGSLATIWVRSKSSHSPTAQLKDLAGIGSVGITPVPPVANCPVDPKKPICTPVADLQTAFDNWKDGFGYTGGTEPVTKVFDPVTPEDLPANSECDGYTITVKYTVTDFCGLSNSCTSTFEVLPDILPPVLPKLPDGGNLGCNPAPPECEIGLLAADVCDGEVPVICKAGEIIEDGCQRSQAFTYSAADHCGNSVSKDVIYAWKVDLTDPLFTGCPDKAIDLGCNPADALHTCATALALVTVNDNCDEPQTPSCEAGEVVAEGCYRSQTFTLKAVDECLNDATCVVTYTWKVDLEAPQPETPLIDLVFNCDEQVIISVPSFVDNCDGIVPYSCAVTGAAGADCYTYKYPQGDTEICFQAEDECGNTNMICIKVTVEPCGGHIFPTQTTCCNYLNQSTVTELKNVCYTASGGSVTNATPGVFFYFISVKAPSANFTIDVIQTKEFGKFNYFAIQQGKDIKLYNAGCKKLNTVTPSEKPTGQAHLEVTGATPGAEYILAVKYDVKSIIGSTYSGSAPECKFTFVTKVSYFIDGTLKNETVPDSEGSITAVSGCTDNTPIPWNCTMSTGMTQSARSAFDPVNLSVYPNPFSTTTSFEISMNADSYVRLEIFSSSGMPIEVILSEDLKKGDTRTISFDGSRYSNIVFIYRITAESRSQSGMIMRSR